MQAQIDAAFRKEVVPNNGIYSAHNGAPPATLSEPGAVRKYRNIPTAYASIQGFERKYDSIKEAQRAQELDRLVVAKLVRWWLPERRIYLPGGVNYYPDFEICWEPDGVVTFEDVKAKDRETQTSKNKRKQAQAIFGIEVQIVDGSVK